MKKLSIISLILIFVLNFKLSAQKEILKDPLFKKPDKSWHLGKTSEYKKLKEKFKMGVFSVDISHSSERYYLTLITPAELEVDKIYQLSFEFKSKGSGEVFVAYKNYYDVFKKKRVQLMKSTLPWVYGILFPQKVNGRKLPLSLRPKKFHLLLTLAT